MSATVARPVEQPMTTKAWIATFGAILGAFMAVLDIQITNASLSDITGGLGATLEDGAWISTSYLVAEIIIIPLSGFLSQVFSLRSYLLFTSSLFLCFSVACGLSWNLQSMIIFRAFQGITGGALIPLAFQVILSLPTSKRTFGLAMFSITATFAPAIGPTIGGYLTDAYNWTVIFYLNIVPGILMISAVWYGIEPEKKKLELLKTADYPGIITMAIGLSSLTVLLEEGERDDWFGSKLIRYLSVTSAVFLSAFLYIEFTRKKCVYQSTTSRSAKLRLWLSREFHGWSCDVRSALSSAALSHFDSTLQLDLYWPHDDVVGASSARDFTFRADHP